MDPETCIILPPAIAEALMRGDLVYQAPPSLNWTVIVTMLVLGLLVIEGIRVGFVLWRDFY